MILSTPIFSKPLYLCANVRFQNLQQISGFEGVEFLRSVKSLRKARTIQCQAFGSRRRRIGSRAPISIDLIRRHNKFERRFGGLPQAAVAITASAKPHLWIKQVLTLVHDPLDHRLCDHRYDRTRQAAGMIVVQNAMLPVGQVRARILSGP